MTATLLTPSYNRQHVTPEHKRNNSNQNADNLQAAGCLTFSCSCKQHIYMWMGSVLIYATSILILILCTKDGQVVVPFNAMNAYRTSWGKLHSFLTSAADGGEWSTSYPEKEPRYPPNRRLGGPKRQYECFGKKNSYPLLGVEPRIIQPVA